MNNIYTNSYYLFLIVELLTVNSNFQIRIVTIISSIVFFRNGCADRAATSAGILWEIFPVSLSDQKQWFSASFRCLKICGFRACIKENNFSWLPLFWNCLWMIFYWIDCFFFVTFFSLIFRWRLIVISFLINYGLNWQRNSIFMLKYI